MKKVFFIILIIVLFSSNKNIILPKSLEFRINNKTITDNTILKIELANNTNKNYYLLLDTLSFYNKYAPFYANDCFGLYYFGMNSSKGEQILTEYVDYECYDDLFYKNEEKYLSSRNVLKIKAKSKLILNVPFRMKTIISNYCLYGYQKQNIKSNRQYFINFSYLKPNEYAKTILSKAKQDSLSWCERHARTSTFWIYLPVFIGTNVTFAPAWGQVELMREQ